MSESPQRIYRYRGVSMWPCFQEGDLLEIDSVGRETLKTGDCVVLGLPGGDCMVHRVTGTRGSLRTRGDAMAACDRFADGEPALLGRVRSRYRGGRQVRVAGGWRGRLAGAFFRYAGRLDPQRPTRGGRLARVLRRLGAPIGGWLLRRGGLVTIRVLSGAELLVWERTGWVLAQRTNAAGPWRAYWPWLLVVPARLDRGGVVRS